MEEDLILPDVDVEQLRLQVTTLTNQLHQLWAHVNTLPASVTTTGQFRNESPNIDKFKGEPGKLKISEWLRQVNEILLMGRTTEPVAVKIASALRFMEGNARAWYLQYTAAQKKLGVDPFPTWEDFEDAIASKYKVMEPKTAILRAITVAQQYKNEDIAAFYSRLLSLFDEYESADGQLSDDSKLDYFRSKLQPWHQAQLADYEAMEKARDSAFELDLS